jgi:hypothetical protein
VLVLVVRVLVWMFVVEPAVGPETVVVVQLVDVTETGLTIAAGVVELSEFTVVVVVERRVEVRLAVEPTSVVVVVVNIVVVGRTVTWTLLICTPIGVSVSFT